MRRPLIHCRPHIVNVLQMNAFCLLTIAQNFRSWTQGVNPPKLRTYFLLEFSAKFVCMFSCWFSHVRYILLGRYDFHILAYRFISLFSPLEKWRQVDKWFTIWTAWCSNPVTTQTPDFYTSSGNKRWLPYTMDCSLFGEFLTLSFGPKGPREQHEKFPKFPQQTAIHGIRYFSNAN